MASPLGATSINRPRFSIPATTTATTIIDCTNSSYASSNGARNNGASSGGASGNGADISGAKAMACLTGAIISTPSNCFKAASGLQNGIKNIE